MECPSSEPAVNIDELLARVDNDRALLRDLVLIFKGDFPGQISALREAISESNWKFTEIMSHTLKGMFLALAAPRATACAVQLEHLGCSGDQERLQSELTILENEVALVMLELELHLAKTES